MRVPYGMCVTPCMGVWIEISKSKIVLPDSLVTPCMGVWIEIDTDSNKITAGTGHSLYGSVD